VNKRRPNERDPAATSGAGTGLCAVAADGTIQGGNGRLAVLLGLPLDELAGLPLEQFLPGVLALGDDVPHDLIGHRADGAPLALVVTVAPLALVAGSAHRVVVIRDLGPVAPPAPAPGRSPQDGLTAVLDAIGDHLYGFTIGADGGIRTTFCGPGSEAILGGPLPAGADLVTAWARAIHPDDRATFERHLVRLAGGESTEDVVRIIGLDGATRSIGFRSWPTPADGLVAVHGIASDATGKLALERVLKATVGATRREADALEAAHREADHRARTDDLTGVCNRRHLSETLVAELDRARAGHRAPAVLLLDIDHFKRINDAYGHAAGDAVLVAVARRIASSVRTSDITARWGGEEFCVLLRGVDDDDALRDVAEGVRLRIESEPVQVEGLDLAVTASVGGARATPDLLDADDLVDAADRALYAAKRRGRNQVRLYSDWRFEDFVAADPEAVRIAEALAMTASLREGTSSLHPMQVAELAMRTAQLLGAPSPVVLRCRLGGWLHDVGKVAIPDAVLNKSGDLEPEERRLLQQHPEIGAEIIQRVAGLKEAVRAVRHHHERWDGTGYPHGLVAEAIPIEARIVAAADVYSALTSDRTYRKALDRAEALAELDRLAGTQLDPLVVPALVRVLTEDRVRLDARFGRGDVEVDRRRSARRDQAA
jgi:diguanylate cyclase (GGDEF)-like protein/putative nucleotidyltransferase with HDIG domain